MKAPYSPDSLQNTLNGKEQFSFHRSKRKEINPYTSRTEKTLTFCREAGKFPHERNVLNLFLMPPWSLPGTILNQIDHAVQHCLHPFSSADKFWSTDWVYHLEKSKSTMLLGFYCKFHVYFLWFVSRSYLLKTWWDTAYHNTAPTCEEFPAQCHKTHWLKTWPRPCSQKEHLIRWWA